MPSGSLAVGALVNGVFIIMPANMAAGARRINTSILFTNRKLPSIHSESVPRSSSKGCTYSYAKKTQLQNLKLLQAHLMNF